MKTTDIKPLMTFSAVDICSYYFVVDEVDHEKGIARGRSWGCFGGTNKAEEELARLADEKVFGLCVQDTIGAMDQKIRFLHDALFLQSKYMEALRADLRRVQLYVDDAALGEYGYRDPEGKLCSDLLEAVIHPPPSDLKLNPDGTIATVKGELNIATKVLDLLKKNTNVEPLPDAKTWRRCKVCGDGFERAGIGELCALCGAAGGREKAIRVNVKNHDEPKKLRLLRHGVEHAGLNVVDVDGSLLCKKPCEWCDALKDRCASRGGTVHADPAKFPPVPKEDPIDEISAVLWFLATLTIDHEPLCGVKACGPCDCEKLIPDNDHWYDRVRDSLQLIGKLKQEATRRAIMSCNGCGTQLRSGELMVCAGCAKKTDLDIEYRYETKKPKSGRILQLKPMPGTPGPNGNGTVYEVDMPDGVVRLVVLRAERHTVSPEEYIAMRKLYTKLFKGTVGVALICPGDELTVLELP